MEDRKKPYNISAQEETWIPNNFYYKNAYLNDENKAQWNFRKVKDDLTPFNDYLQKSINNQRKASKISAECFKVETRLILKPRFTLLKLKSQNCVTIKIPKGNYYIVDWNDDWEDIKNFEAVAHRRDTIFDEEAIIDIYNSKLLFKCNKDIDCSLAYKLFIKDCDNEETCYIRKLDFGNIEDFRIQSDNFEAIATSVSGNNLTIIYQGTLSNDIILFGQTKEQDYTVQEVDLSKADISIDNAKAVFWNDEFLLSKIEVDESNLPLVIDGVKYEYEIIDKEKIEQILSDRRLRYKDRKIEIVDSSIGDVGEKIIIKGLTFEIMSLGDKITRQYAKHGSVIIEIIEDDSVVDDVYSNVSYFFRETTERLVDESGRQYKIGKKYEQYNQLEIIEQDGKDFKKVEKCPSKLSIVPNVRQLQMQKNALQSLISRPTIDHAPLIELMEEKKFATWMDCNYSSIHINKWYKLTNPKYEGCLSQREFVKKALATNDFAILEGPPGSGKTTTILEIIAQMIIQGKKVLLAASTNAAIDNILERINGLPEEITNQLIAVRLGMDSAISDSVEIYKANGLGIYKEEVIRRANLVCGTIIGVLQHPDFKLGDYGYDKLPTTPLYDCLIIDEASKTTFQEFLVPALYAKKWILSGDLKQLTPYIDKENLEASLTQIEKFDVYHQQAQSYLMLLDKEVYGKSNKDDDIRKTKFCVVVDEKILDALVRLKNSLQYKKVGLLGKTSTNDIISKIEFLNGSLKNVVIYGCDILFIDKDIYDSVVYLLPSEFIVINNKSCDYSDYQNAVKYKRFTSSVLNTNTTCIKKLKEKVATLLKDKSWAGEIAWRLCRIQELFMLRDFDNSEKSVVDRYKKEVEERIPDYVYNEVSSAINLLKEIALPSILQLLQEGLDSNVVSRRKTTALNDGFDNEVLEDIHTLVEYQHRMHPDISNFSANEIYKGEALSNGTVIDRNWGYNKYHKRALWIDVNSKISNNNSNRGEVDKIINEIKEFLEFAKNNPKKDGSLWSIACLTYYRKQETLLKEGIKRLFKDKKAKSYHVDESQNIEIMIYSVDKFQGKEADIVFLSMVKSGTVGLGFMDSPNRLNVALTRAKYQMVIVGDKSYFKSNRCKSKLLQKVAEVY